jgi:HEAT repeat protein
MSYGVKRCHWPKLLLGLAAALIYVLVTLVTTETRAADGGSELAAKIELVIEQIKAERSTTVRTDVARRLCALLQHQARSDLDALEARPVDDIAGLLGDRDDSVRYWAAMALGQIGPSANRAVPALERALKEIEPVPGVVVPAKSSESGIRFALRRIAGKPGSFAPSN